MDHDKAREIRRSLRRQSLQLAVTAARLSSVSRAAVALEVSQPTVSQAIADLERRCGAVLFRRDGRGIRPTSAGERVISLAENLLADLDRLEHDMAALGSDNPVPVSIGMPPSVAGMLASALVGDVAARLPGIDLRVVESYSGSVQRGLLAGDLDVGIVYANQSLPGTPTDRVISERLVLIGAADDPRMEEDGPVRLDAVARLPLVLPSRGNGLRQLVDQQARRAGCKLTVAVEIDAMAAAKEVCEPGGLYAILPSCAMSREGQAGRLKARPVVEPDLVRDLSVATTTARPLTRAARAVARQAVETARSLVASQRWQAAV